MKYGIGHARKNEYVGSGLGRYLGMIPFVGTLLLGCHETEYELSNLRINKISADLDNNGIIDRVWVDEINGAFLTPPDTVRVMASMNGGEPIKLLERYGKWGYLKISGPDLSEIKVVLHDVRESEEEELLLPKKLPKEELFLPKEMPGKRWMI